MKFEHDLHELPYYAAHPTLFLAHVERLKEEHESMQLQLRDIRKRAGSLYLLDDCDQGMCKLIDLQDRIVVLIDDLDRHSEWEEKELFPILQTYFNRYIMPSITPSI